MRKTAACAYRGGRFFRCSMRKLLVAFLPRIVADWIWCWAELRGVDLGEWYPHIYGRMLGGYVTWRRIR